jgi:hypothetical protein
LGNAYGNDSDLFLFLYLLFEGKKSEIDKALVFGMGTSPVSPEVDSLKEEIFQHYTELYVEGSRVLLN